MPQSDVNVMKYFSNFCLAGIVTGSASTALVWWNRFTRSMRGTSAREVILYEMLLRRI